jgi:hypothetical protein
LTAKGRTVSGGFYLVKGKAFENGGESSKLENAFGNYFPIPLANYKRI